MIPGNNKKQIKKYNISYTKKTELNYKLGINLKELFDYTEWAVETLYDDLKNNRQYKNKIKCQEQVVEKILNNKEKYRMTDDIDRMNIQYVGLKSSHEKGDEKYIKIKLSVYFYDNTKNNVNIDEKVPHKYWNDIWIVTYKNIDSINTENSNCENCGATMNYNIKNKTYRCEYCGNIYVGENINWEICDIEVEY